MTANHEHTPTKRDFELAWDFYRAHQDYALARTQHYHEYQAEFDRWLNQVKADAWDEAMTKQIQRLISDYPDAERFQMPANPYRADRIANKEAGDGDDAAS